MYKEDQNYDFQYQTHNQSQYSYQNNLQNQFTRMNQNPKGKVTTAFSKSKRWGNQLLSQCKAVIQQQSEELSLLSDQLQRKASIIQANIQEKQNLKATIVHLQKNLIEKNNKIGCLEQKLRESQSEVIKLSTNLKESLSQKEALEASLERQKLNLKKANQQNSKLIAKIKTEYQKIETLEQTMALINGENQHLNQVIQYKQKQSKWEIQNLKKFNENLKKKFELLELDGFSEVANQDFNVNIRNQYTNDIVASPEKSNYRKRAYSSDKKRVQQNCFNQAVQNEFSYNGKLINDPYRNLKQPQAFLSAKSTHLKRYNNETTNNTINNTANNFLSYKSQHQTKAKNNTYRKPFFISEFELSPIGNNPEMTAQLNNIKEHISRQYTKMANKKTILNSRTKERGLKVLQALQRKAWRLVSQAQKSDQQGESFT